MANIIAENLYSQCDSEGRSFLVLKEIVDHAKDHSAIPISDGFTISYNGNKVPKKTTRGWKLLCQWKDNAFYKLCAFGRVEGLKPSGTCRVCSSESD
jgi:hypothetical protein